MCGITTKTYIKCETPDESKTIQLYLFSKGYKWAFRGIKVSHTHSKYLVVHNIKITNNLLHGDTYNGMYDLITAKAFIYSILINEL